MNFPNCYSYHEKLKSWMFTYIFAVLVNKFVLVTFSWFIPECRSELVWTTCTLGEVLVFFLDWFSLAVVFIISSYMFLLNIVLIRKYSQTFSVIVGSIAGASSIIIYPSDGLEKLDLILDWIFDRNTPFDLVIIITSFLLLFGILFWLAVATNWLVTQLSDGS